MEQARRACILSSLDVPFLLKISIHVRPNVHLLQSRSSGICKLQSLFALQTQERGMHLCVVGHSYSITSQFRVSLSASAWTQDISGKPCDVILSLALYFNCHSGRNEDVLFITSIVSFSITSFYWQFTQQNESP